MLHMFSYGAIEYEKIEMKFMSQTIHTTSYQKESVHESWLVELFT